MVTLRHPIIRKVTVDVDPECVPRWVASGWVDSRVEDGVAFDVRSYCCGDGPDGPCADCPTPESEPVEGVRILPVDPPKPAPRRRKKTPPSATTR